MGTTGRSIEERLAILSQRGVIVVDPRQTWIGPEVDPTRIGTNVVLHPGSRLTGSRTHLATGAEVGREGPATLIDAVLGPRARIDSGFAERAVLLADASAGANAHLRDGTLLEEQASTAHAVGLKHTILFPYVTLGSLINFCDCLLAGGTSRRDHSEVGSGFIHFNYTPWGSHGDKATPSLFGDVARGVFLRQARIFLGGSAGVVGPRRVGFGSVVAAGQVLRKDIGDDRVVGQSAPEVDRPRQDAPPSAGKIERNLYYVANLVALDHFYEHVRCARVSPDDLESKLVFFAARENIATAIAERKRRLDALLVEHGREPISWPTFQFSPCPLELSGSTGDHLAWIHSLSAAQVSAGATWLADIVDTFVAAVQ